jgi:hypothetical protein
MKLSAFIPILLLLLIIGGAQATIINSTVLLTTDYNAELKMEISDPMTNSPFSYSVPSNNAVVVVGMNYYTEGSTTQFRFSRPSASDITGSVSLVSTGLFTGEERIQIDGGSSSVNSYYKIPLYPAFPPTTWYYVTDGNGYYFVGTDASRFNFAVSGDIFHPVYAPFKLDTNADAYIQISGDPDASPISQVSVTPIDSGTYSAMVYFESIPALKEAIKYTNSTQQAYGESGFDLSFLKKLIDIIYGAYKQLQAFYNTITALSTWIMAIGAFLFGVKVIVGVVVLHLMINIVYSMSKHMKGVDDVFLAFLKIIDNERKLLMFFKEIFMFIKDLIKWW